MSHSWISAVTICSDFEAQENKVCHCFHCFHLFAMKWCDQMPCSLFFECWVLSQLFHLLQSCPTVWSHGLQPATLLCPWDSPDKTIGVHCHALLQGIVPPQASNTGLLHCRRILLPSEIPQGSSISTESESNLHRGRWQRPLLFTHWQCYWQVPVGNWQPPASHESS